MEPRGTYPGSSPSPIPYTNGVASVPDNVGKDFTARFQASFPEAAKESKSTLIPFLLEGVGNVENLNQPDGIHPTAEGQAKVAENVWKNLQPVVTQ